MKEEEQADSPQRDWDRRCEAILPRPAETAAVSAEAFKPILSDRPLENPRTLDVGARLRTQLVKL